EVVVLELSAVQIQPYENTKGRAMAGKARIRRKNNRKRICDEYFRIIKKKMTEACAKECCQSNVQRECVYMFYGTLFYFENMIHDLLAQDKSDSPHQSIPADGPVDSRDGKDFGINRLCDLRQEIMHHALLY